MAVLATQLSSGRLRQRKMPGPGPRLGGAARTPAATSDRRLERLRRRPWPAGRRAQPSIAAAHCLHPPLGELVTAQPSARRAANLSRGLSASASRGRFGGHERCARRGAQARACPPQAHSPSRPLDDSTADRRHQGGGRTQGQSDPDTARSSVPPKPEGPPTTQTRLSRAANPRSGRRRSGTR